MGKLFKEGIIRREPAVPSPVPLAQAPGGGENVQLILLDFGLAEELSPLVRHHFISFLNMIAKGDAAAATRHLLLWSANQNCKDPQALAGDMRVLFERWAALKRGNPSGRSHAWMSPCSSTSLRTCFLQSLATQFVILVVLAPFCPDERLHRVMKAALACIAIPVVLPTFIQVMDCIKLKTACASIL